MSDDEQAAEALLSQDAQFQRTQLDATQIAGVAGPHGLSGDGLIASEGLPDDISNLLPPFDRSLLEGIAAVGSGNILLQKICHSNGLRLSGDEMLSCPLLIDKLMAVQPSKSSGSNLSDEPMPDFSSRKLNTEEQRLLEPLKPPFSEDQLLKLEPACKLLYALCQRYGLTKPNTVKEFVIVLLLLPPDAPVVDSVSVGHTREPDPGLSPEQPEVLSTKVIPQMPSFGAGMVTDNPKNTVGNMGDGDEPTMKDLMKQMVNLTTGVRNVTMNMAIQNDVL